MRIIPAIDIIEGKCVRLTKGDYNNKKVYNEDPLEAALMFEDAGIGYLHLVDLDGAKASHIVNWKVLERLASKTSLAIDFGGGVKTDEDMRIAFECGAKQVTGGSIAVKSPEVFLGWLEQYGTEKVILGADLVKGMVATNGWQEIGTNEGIPFIENYVKKGVQYVVCTDIDKDGMLAGPSVELYKEILDQIPEIKLIASGGVTSVEDIETLAQLGLDGAIIGKAIYENKLSIQDLQRFLLC